MNPFVFFVGCPRSGTTLVRRIADAHPQLAVVHESRWIPTTYRQREGLTEDGVVTLDLMEHLRDPSARKPFEIDEDEMEELVRSAEGTHFSTFASGLFDLYGERHGKRLVGDKTPGYVRYMTTLDELWPEATFVHIIRDGRDVALSVLDWKKGAARFTTFEEDPITTIAVWWTWYVTLGLEASRAVDGRYHEIRYECLVSEPEEVAAAVCDFLGIAYDDAMLHYWEGRRRDDPNLSAKKRWLPITPGLRSWKDQLTRDDVERFEAGAGWLMDELGYPRAHAHLPRASVAHADDIRERFIEQARARGRPLPERWLA